MSITTFGQLNTPGYQNGDQQTSQFRYPSGICFDTDTDTLYIVDTSNHCVRTLDTITGQISTFVGSGTSGNTDGQGTDAQFSFPKGICMDPEEKVLYVSDCFNSVIRKVDMQGNVSTFVGSTEGDQDGPADECQINYPFGMCFDSDARCLYFCDMMNNKIKKVDLSDSMVTTVASNEETKILGYPSGICLEPETKMLYVTSPMPCTIVQVNTEDGAMRVFAGSDMGDADGISTEAKFDTPTGICLDRESKALLVCDAKNNKLKSISLEDEHVSTFLGLAARFEDPECVHIDDNTKRIFISDMGHNVIKIYTPK
eukprot:TRINITY_DN11955_c0_g1_i1.p1 TRINITY_DN11955_c0_g1~~TRINITY_DN11955_c0_g1_i1.p1  ORF type:complete len:336 (+),score=63.86 TRINITY_DN11955_c0_g1_i1:71-1009(+)